MTNAIFTHRTSPYDFLLDHMHMVGSPAQDTSVTVLRELAPDDSHPMCECGNGYEDFITLRFEKEWQGRLMSFIEHTCVDCGRRQYVV